MKKKKHKKEEEVAEKPQRAWRKKENHFQKPIIKQNKNPKYPP